MAKLKPQKEVPNEVMLAFERIKTTILDSVEEQEEVDDLIMIANHIWDDPQKVQEIFPELFNTEVDDDDDDEDKDE